jgi:hypothetical protein
MKQFLLLCAFILSMRNPLLSQYIYFNNVYQSDPVENPLPLFLYELNNNYYIYGSNNDNNFNLTLNFWNINSAGEINEFYVFPEEQDVFVIGYNSGIQSGVTLNDSSVVLLKGGFNYYCTNTNEYLPSFNLCRIYEDSVIWNIEEPLLINNACETSSEYKAFGLFLDANQNIVVFCNVLKPGLNEGVNQVRGHSLTYFTQEGEFIEHFDFVQAEPEFDGYDVVKAIYPFDGYSIGIANTRGNGGGKHALMKLDNEGQIIDSLHFGNPDYSNNEGFNGDMHFTTLENGNLLLLYSWCDYYYYWPNQNAQFKMYTAIVNPETFEVIYNEQIASPIDDIFTQGGVLVWNSLHRSDNQNIFLYRYTSLPDFVAHNVIWSIDSLGQTIWLQEYLSPNDPNDAYIQTEGLSGAIETADGGILCFGTSSQFFFDGIEERDTWLLKLDACGYEEPSDCPPVVSVSNTTEVPGFDTWPNPFRNNLKAKLPANAKRVQWLDATGRLVHSENVYYPNQEWNLRHLPIGLYHMQVLLEDGGVISQKVMKE